MDEASVAGASYDELASLVASLLPRVEALEADNAGLRAENASLRAENASLRAENEALKRKLGTDSSNSSTPPSQDSPAAKGKRRAQRSQRQRSSQRKPGGQPGRKGSGLSPASSPDRTETAPAPEDCSSCGQELSQGQELSASWTQVWDIPPVALQKVHYRLPRRRCRCCGTTTTAAVPFGKPGNVVYGANVNAAAILLSSAGNVPIERTAMLMGSLLGSPVSTGFVARAHERFADALEGAGFDEAMTAALAREPVLCGDETPVNVATKDRDSNGDPVPGAPHVVVVRSPDERLIWYRSLSARSKKALATLGLFSTYTGYLVRDDYVAWHQFDAQLAGTQQCLAHVFRYLAGIHEMHPSQQKWAATARQALAKAHQAVEAAIDAGHDELDPELLGSLRERYDKAVAWGQTTNRHRDWADGNHPGYTLARRLADKADQVWLFTTNFAIPWTNNASEQALKSPKLHQKVSGYWHNLTTLDRFCRVRSYLTSAGNHGHRAIDAIHDALTGNPWLPAY